jgi:8-oxo-dGTP diphosphatase
MRSDLNSEADYLERYRASDFPRPAVAVDIVVFTIVDAELRVLLVRRREHPFKGSWALPGGFVRVREGKRDQGEDLDDAAARELEEETGLSPRQVYLAQLAAFGRAGRDPRMRVITVAYYALVRPDLVPLVSAGGDATNAEWFPLDVLSRNKLAFDHGEIIDAARRTIADRLHSSDVAFHLVPRTFTVPELRSTYEILAGVPFDPGNFRRRFQRMVEDGIIEQAPGKRITASKPAAVYRFRSKGGER